VIGAFLDEVCIRDLGKINLVSRFDFKLEPIFTIDPAETIFFPK